MKIPHPQRRIDRGSQRGVSLVELMIAMTIGIVVVGAVGYLYLGTRQTFRTADNLSRVQENARYAMEMMARDIRMAGYIGCGNIATIPVNTIAITNPAVSALSTATAITGEDTTGLPMALYRNSTITRVAGDAITVKGAFGGGVGVTGNWEPSNANAQIVGNPYGFKQDDVLVVTNCTTADVFRVTNAPGNAGVAVQLTTTAHAQGANGNSGNRIFNYGPDSFVFKMAEYSYFLGTNPGGRRALYRTNPLEPTANLRTVELVEGVEDMQIQYGIDTDGDSAANSYTTAGALNAAATWPQVVSARIHLLLASPENGLAATAQSYFFPADTTAPPTNPPVATAGDRRLYQVFTSTIGIRNRLP